MAHGPRYKVPKRRRRQGKTNYYKRYRMILSGKPRFIVRKTLKNIIVQVAEATIKGDTIIAAAHSRELAEKYGWKASTSNLPAAYLTGLLAALRARKKNISYAVPDIGLHEPKPGAKIFAAIKAANDAGLKVPIGKNVIPPDNRIRGEHIASWARKLQEESPDLYNRLFSQYVARGFDPVQLPAHFEETRNKILEEFGALKEG